MLPKQALVTQPSVQRLWMFLTVFNPVLSLVARITLTKAYKPVRHLALAIMISQFFLLTPRGDTIVSKDYRGDVPRGGVGVLSPCSNARRHS